MLVKDLIKTLQILDPEALVGLQIGRSQEYREMCAKAELAGANVLDVLIVDMVEIHDEGEDGLWLNIILKQANISYLPEIAEEFDKMYKKQQDDENK